MNIHPYGICLVVPDDAFRKDWETSLGNQAYRCFRIDLDDNPVTLVLLEKTTKAEDENHPIQVTHNSTSISTNTRLKHQLRARPYTPLDTARRSTIDYPLGQQLEQTTNRREIHRSKPESNTQRRIGAFEQNGEKKQTTAKKTKSHSKPHQSGRSQHKRGKNQQ